MYDYITTNGGGESTVYHVPSGGDLIVTVERGARGLHYRVQVQGDITNPDYLLRKIRELYRKLEEEYGPVTPAATATDGDVSPAPRVT